jgi:ABC-type Fe3+ transport system permease subunit
MITHLAAAAASCNTGTWGQKWACGWDQPVPASVPHAGYTFGHSLLPALVVLVVAFLLVRAVRRRRKGRAPAPAGAGARR